MSAFRAAVREAHLRGADKQTLKKIRKKESTAFYDFPKDKANAVGAAYLDSIAAQDKQLRDVVAEILNDQQWLRLKQLMVQSSMRDHHPERGLQALGINVAKLDVSSEQLEEFKRFRGDDIQVAKFDAAQDAWFAAIDDAIGKTARSKMTGKKMRFLTKYRRTDKPKQQNSRSRGRRPSPDK